jgi:PadR family transcriptional regulator PadR
VELALLLLLKIRSHYGLELLEKLNGEAQLDVADGTIYPLLHRLQRQGSVKSQWETDTPNGRPRKYYSLTRAGDAHCLDLLESWKRLGQGIDKILDGETSEDKQ